MTPSVICKKPLRGGFIFAVPRVSDVDFQVFESPFFFDGMIDDACFGGINIAKKPLPDECDPQSDPYCDLEPVEE